MPSEALHSAARAAASNEWLAIFPELLLGCLAIGLLLCDMLLPASDRKHIPVLAIVGQIAVLVGTIVNYNTLLLYESTFGGLLAATADGLFMRMFFLVCSILVSVLATITFARRPEHSVEFYHIVLVVTAALMLLVQSHHFVMLFVALETVTVGFYILVGYFRTSALSLEAGLKYLIMGALSSSILLFGIVLLYGAAGNHALPN